jgi:ATP-binding cassette subfamily F protein 3
MVIVSASGISKSYGVNTILEQVSFHINEGDRIGIIGDNGAGKSTLLSILSGQLSYDAGELFISSQTDLGYLKQHDNFSSENTVYQEMLSIFSETIAMEETMQRLSALISRKSSEGEDVKGLLSEYDMLMETFERKGGFSYQSEIRGILSSMAFPEGFYEKKISTLSGGERTRLALASLLLQKPGLLLLDEPTNHLDIGTLKWLEQYLKNYSGTLVIVSHDRYFLDQTVNRIFEIQNARLSVYEGNYTLYLGKKKQKEEELQRQYERQNQEIRRQEEIIRRFKQHGTEKLAKRARSREKRLDHIERLARPPVSKGRMKIQFKEKFQSGSDVLMGQNLFMSFMDEGEIRALFEDVNFDIKRGERICIVGPNGIGKTTLLKIIMGQLIPDSGFVRLGHNVMAGYYDQEQAMLRSNLTVLEELHESYRLYSETQLRSILGRFLFRNDDVFKEVNTLSGGERAKLSLLKLMLSGANFLIMDEPTNHLDIAAKEVFEDALLEFPGTVLIVSHDRYLLNKVPTRILELSASGIESYLGGYDYYMEKKQSISSGKSYLEELGRITVADSSAGDEHSTAVQSSKEARLLARRKAKEEEAKKRRRERDLAEVETCITSLEEEIRQLEVKMCTEEVYSDHLLSASYSQKLEKAKEDLDAAYERWAELHERFPK